MQTRPWILLGLALALMWPAAASAGTVEDKAMASQIANEIRESGQLSNFRIGVKFKEGSAWLLGSVADESQAAAAMEVAEQVPGVDRVFNKLKISGGPAKVASNALHTMPAEPAASAKGENAGLLLSMEEPQERAPSRRVSKPAARKLRKSHREPQLSRVASRPAPAARRPMPMPVAYSRGGQPVGQPVQPAQYGGAGPRPAGYAPGGGGATGVGYDSPNLPGYAWPSYAAPQNYSALTYPRQYSPTAWPYIGPFYPYPQVPLGWRKVALEWDDGWWFLDFSHHQSH